MLALITKGILFDKVASITNNFILPLDITVEDTKDITVDVDNVLKLNINVRQIIE